MSTIRLFSRFAWLKLMEGLCLVTGHQLIQLAQHAFCSRCYLVSGVDFGVDEELVLSLRKPQGSAG